MLTSTSYAFNFVELWGAKSADVLASTSEKIVQKPNMDTISKKSEIVASISFAIDAINLETLTLADSPGGYFDGEGVHWTLPDAIGSVELVIDGDGNVKQHTGYYPYGEPWREPTGQPYLFGGKERRRFASLHDSDFHARFLTTATALWQAADPHADPYPWLSPGVFCNANPIRFSDPCCDRKCWRGFLGELHHRRQENPCDITATDCRHITGAA